MIYHILNDEKFSDWVIDSFQKVNEGNNIFLLISNSNASTILKDQRVNILNSVEFLNRVIPRTDDLFIFYFLHIHSIKFLVKYRHLTYKKVWIGYGADYYYYLLREPYFGSLYKKKTKDLFRIKYENNLIKKYIRKIYQYLFFQFKVKKAINQIDFFAPIIPNEYFLIQSVFNFRRLKLLDFTFGDINYLSLDQGEAELGDKILLNNSATFAGNHIDILERLLSLGIKKKIIIPVSYGNEFYKDKLLEYSERHFNDQVELLTGFLPKKDYFRKVHECGFVIMGHLRQQAMGNIYGCLFMGAKLFLFKENPVYIFLKELGILVFQIDQIFEDPEILDVPLNKVEKRLNREKILKYYSEESSLARVYKVSQL